MKNQTMKFPNVRIPINLLVTVFRCLQNGLIKSNKVNIAHGAHRAHGEKGCRGQREADTLWGRHCLVGLTFMAVLVHWQFCAALAEFLLFMSHTPLHSTPYSLVLVLASSFSVRFVCPVCRLVDILKNWLISFGNMQIARSSLNWVKYAHKQVRVESIRPPIFPPLLGPSSILSSGAGFGQRPADQIPCYVDPVASQYLRA